MRLCTVQTIRQQSCTDRPYKATARLASVPEYSTYCTLAARRKVPYARLFIDKGKRGIGNGSKIMFGSVPRMTS